MLLFGMISIHPSRASAAILFLLVIAPRVSFGDSPAAGGWAIPGSPLGVAQARFEIPETSSLSPGGERFSLAGDHRRILYPVFLPDPVAATPAGPAATPSGFQVLFLFPGTDPISLIVTTNLSSSPYREFHAKLTPAAAPANELQAGLRTWWQSYRGVLAAAQRRDGYYPVLENYLTWHLPRLAGLEPEPFLSAAPRLTALESIPELTRLFDLLLGTESIRIALARDSLLGTSPDATEATEPLPEPPAIPEARLPPGEPGVAIEPIARCVPVECLYAWFPRLSEFRSLQHRAETWGGNLYDLLTGRSLDAGVRDMLETQLALRETVLSRLFGDLAIGQTALLAADTFVREGSALGIVFEVKNEQLFRRSIEELRRKALEASKSWVEGPAVEEKLTIGGREVSLLHAPGNRIRSFHAEAPPFHLVTNSRRLVERFLSCAAGGPGSLADDAGFRHARTLHPLAAPQSALVFISDPFLRQLIGPAYRAEMTRRTRARVMLELAEVASRVARTEGAGNLDLDRLVAAGYLPASISRRPEGGRLIATAAGPADSLRGSRGTFLPIPDLEVRTLTRAESREYAEFSRFYQRQWGRMDPAVIRIWAPPGEAGGPGVTAGGPAPARRVQLFVDLLPFAREPYQALQGFLHAPGRRSLEPLPGEVLSLQAEVGRAATGDPFWAGAGVLDFERPFLSDGGAGRLFSDPVRLPAYLILPITGRLPGGSLRLIFLTAVPGPGGIHQLEGGLGGVPVWGREIGERVVLSPRRETALTVAESIRFGEEPPAQVRMRLSGLQGAKIGPAIRAAAFERTRQASLAAAELLSALHGVLKVPLEDCGAEVQRILGARVACPAGGRFLSSPFPLGGGLFFSSEAFPEEKDPRKAALRAEAFPHPVVDGLLRFEIRFTLSGTSLHSEADFLLAEEEGQESKVESRK